MIPIQIALVRYYKGDYVERDTFMRVAAALQVQLTRDFTPIWGTRAVVSAFESLDEVPPACLPLIIVAPGSLQSREHAFHLSPNGKPMALVEAGEGWSLPASHELLEMVCDPSGMQKVMGESIADLVGAREIAPGAEKHLPQGQVAYLVEICDPCQASHYTVNGFQVSDFVTPQYYVPGAMEHGRYSFTGKITHPRQLLPGGYITWFTSIEEAPVWQAIRDQRGSLTVAPLPGPTTASSRDEVGYLSDLIGGSEAKSEPSVPAANAESLARASAKRYGRELEKDLNDLLESFKPTVPLAHFLQVLHDLAYDEPYWQRIAKDPDSLYDELKHAIPDRFVFIGKQFPSREQFRAVYEPLKRRSDREAVRNVSRDEAILAMHGTTIWGPPQPPPHH